MEISPKDVPTKQFIGAFTTFGMLDRWPAILSIGDQAMSYDDDDSLYKMPEFKGRNILIFRTVPAKQAAFCSTNREATSIRCSERPGAVQIPR
jgi:hypothetical protein